MNIRTYREMYDHIEASGEQKKKIFNEILDADESKMWENKNLHILMAAIVVIALVVILPVGGYAAQKLNTHFTYSVQKPGKDHKAVLHIKKKYGEILKEIKYLSNKNNKDEGTEQELELLGNMCRDEARFMRKRLIDKSEGGTKLFFGKNTIIKYK